MSVPEIKELRDSLLLELERLQANNRNPQNAVVICHSLHPDVDWNDNRELARSAAWLLVRNDLPLAKTVPDSEKPNALLIALTAQGKLRASEIRSERRKPSWKERISKVPVGKGVWEISKLGLAALIGAWAQSYFGS